MAKCDCVTISKAEWEELMARAKRCDPAPKKKTATKKKTVKKASKKPVRAKTTAKTVRTTKKRTMVSKTKSKAKSKAVSKNRNANVNANNISVAVRSNPKAVSNVYIVAPPQQAAMPVLEAPKKKRRDREVPYNAPYLQRRDGSAPMLPAPVRTSVRYVERPAPVQRAPMIAMSSGRRGKRTAQAVQIPEVETIQVSAPVTALPAPQTSKAVGAPIYYQLKDGKSVALEDCRAIQDPTEKAACQQRNRKKAKLE